MLYFVIKQIKCIIASLINMGIPSYFSYIVKNHPEIIKKYIKDCLKVDNLYLDCNSIIYDAYAKMNTENITENVTSCIISRVITKLEEYIEIICPSKTIIIAFDGVAPVAKLEQQRSRRYKSWYQNEISRNLFKKTKPDIWNTTAITPGTLFMKELNQKINNYFKNNTYNVDKIIISGSNEVGEGEHKLFDFIRKFPEKHANETSVIYGLDADLIMLSINHLPISPKIYLFRETPHFIQSIDNSLEPNANYFLDIPELSINIINYMNNEIPIENEKQKNKIYDYIFLCFFLGNDFLPHFPALNIRTGGVDKMLNAYRAVISNSSENLTDGKIIYWNNVRKVVDFLANAEEVFIRNEHKNRDKRENNEMHRKTPEEKLKYFESTPVYERDVEKYINPFKPCWQDRYYKALFGIKSDSDQQQRRDICINYMQGLEWTMRYYTSGCPDWRWHYKYNYPPLLQDLVKYIPIFTTTFIKETKINPVNELVQLCYVLPHSSLHLLPNRLHLALIQNYPNWYKNNFDFVWAYCRYFWESHVEMTDIDIDELEGFILNNRHLLQ
jgi:5'-3' exoribonuclease 1